MRDLLGFLLEGGRVLWEGRIVGVMREREIRSGGGKWEEVGVKLEIGLALDLMIDESLLLDLEGLDIVDVFFRGLW